MTQRERGRLEADILDILWNSPDPLTVKSIQEAFAQPQPAVTTLITVLERLRAKGKVDRRAAGGRSYEYFASRSRLDQANESIHLALENAGDRQAALMLLAGSLTEADKVLLAKALASQTKPTKKSSK